MAGIKRNINEIKKEKRKHTSLTILEKVEILSKMEEGYSITLLADLYGCATRTLYDIKKNKDNILQYFSDLNAKSAIGKRKSVSHPKFVNLDNKLYEWYQQKSTEGFAINGVQIKKKAEQLHKFLKIEQPCSFSSGWLTRFMKRHGIKSLKTSKEKLFASNEFLEDSSLCSELPDSNILYPEVIYNTDTNLKPDKQRSSSNNKTVDKFIDEFSEFVMRNEVNPELIYNAHETVLFWRSLPQNTVANQKKISDCKDNEKVSLLVCSNATGTHKCKLLLVSKDSHIKCLKNVKVLPFIYASNYKGLLTPEIITLWLKNHFLKEATKHCCDVGLPENSKILLLLDNCKGGLIVSEQKNISILVLPPNTASYFQPMNQGILNCLKCFYKTQFIKKLLLLNPSANNVNSLVKEFEIRDCMFLLEKAWNDVTRDTLVHAWKKLWPASIFIETENDVEDFFGFFETESDNDDFGGFSSNEVKQKSAELVGYLKNTLHYTLDLFKYENILKWMEADDSDITEENNDEIIISTILESNKANFEDDEKITFDQGIAYGQKYLEFIQKFNFITNEEFITIHKIQQKLLENRTKLFEEKYS